jgi:hypothetical protein
MSDIPEKMLLEGVAIDIGFNEPRPAFGDLHQICGDEHSLFPPEVALGFEGLVDLRFEQVDDYFGIPSRRNEGDDVIVWLFPLINGKSVDHNLGPYDAIRLAYNVLRNSTSNIELFAKCIERFAQLGKSVTYVSRNIDLGNPPDLTKIRADIDGIVAHWKMKGVTVGSQKALQIDA